MKSKKVLLGLFLGLFASFSGTAAAQINSGSGLVEVGPDNIGGRVTSLIVDKRDHTHNTLFAGAASGGLFIKSNNTDFCDYATIWQHIPYLVEGKEVTLPISAMVQLPNDDLVIATGEGAFQQGSRLERLAAMGRGLFRYNPSAKDFTPIANTQPASMQSPWAAVNKLASFERNGSVYVFAATQKGLYRWVITDENSWATAPVLVSDTVPVYDVAAVPLYNMLYFTAQNALYRIGDVEHASAAQNISNVNAAFSDGNAKRIFLATNEAYPTYLYAMVIGSTGILKGVYLTTNQSTWDTLTTSTVTPFTVNKGTVCGAMAIDPSNADRVYMGGSSIWAGQGYIEHANYQWTKLSQCEEEFYTATGLTGNYMADIFSSYSFVHSGINQIVGTFVDYDTVPTFYIATDGGVFSSHGMGVFTNINRGLNNIQTNSVAVCQDGSVLMGATKNASIFVESRMGHHGGVGSDSWYDHNTARNMNHMGNEIFYGNGGGVAASIFHQYAPSTRRNIFVSNERGDFGRAYSDYADYTNTQTWTTGSNFLTEQTDLSSTNPAMYLWETTNDTRKADSIRVIVDTLAFAFGHDTTYQMLPGTTIRANDTMWISSTGHAGYPFKYAFPEDFTLTECDTVIAKNPIQNHLFIVAETYQNSMTTIHTEDVNMTWMPTDYRKVWYDGSQPASEMMWSKVYSVNKVTNPDCRIADIAVSNDGDMLFIGINNEATNESFIVRVSGIIDSIDYGAGNTSIQQALNLGVGRWMNTSAKLKCDTLMATSTSHFFARPISSLNVDRRPATDAVLVTFEGHDYEGSNVLYMKNATSASPKLTAKTLEVNGKSVPVYSAMIEYTQGDVYLGTEEGVYNATYSDFEANATTWNEYGNFRGVPVVDMCQQVNVMNLVRFTGHTGIAAENYIFPRTKYPYAIYFATYGRGVFMDTAYVTDMTNEIVDSSDYLGIPRVYTASNNSVKVYPNPAVGYTNVELSAAAAGNAQVRIYDLAGKQVLVENWGRVSEGTTTRQIDCQNLKHGMYLINITVGRETATSKLVVR